MAYVVPGRRLRKTRVVTVVQEYVPPRAAVPPIGLMMWAPPPPLGLMYRSLSGGRPNDLASFRSWSPLVQQPVQYTDVLAGYEFVPLPPGGGSIALPPGSSPVYRLNAQGVLELVGYEVPVFVSQPLPPQWWGPTLPNLRYVEFPGVPAAPNGYPLVAGPVRGVFRVPTEDGEVEVARTYVRDGRGVWLPTDTGGLPPYCVAGTPCRIIAMVGFPGRAAVPAVPEVRHIDYRVGWNAGANSAGRLDGDVHLQFPVSVTPQGAAAVGWANARLDPTDFRTLTHAFLFTPDPETGTTQVAVLERGRVLLRLGPAAPNALYHLRRIGGAVHYAIDGDEVFVSAAFSGGPLLVGAALYRADDIVGGSSSVQANYPPDWPEGPDGNEP